VRRFAAAIGAIVAILGCGSTAPEERNPDAACTDLYTAVCTQLAACSPVFAILDGSVDACVTRRSSDCKKSYLGPSSNESAADLEACFRAIAPASCETLLPFLFESYALPDACAGLHGSGAPNAPCAGPDQCASAVCIEQAPYAQDDDACGHCGAGHAAGDICNTLRDCARGLACANGTCVQYASIGEACDAARPCHAGAFCSGGSCARVAAEGEACTSSLGCGLDLVCNKVTHRCAKPVASGGQAGATCGAAASGDVDACAYGFVCSEESSGLQTCLPLGNDGDDCTSHPCAIPLRCILGKCALQSAATCH